MSPSDRRTIHPAIIGFAVGLGAAFVMKTLADNNSTSNRRSSVARSPNKQSYITEKGDDVRDMKRTESSGSPNALKHHGSNSPKPTSTSASTAQVPQPPSSSQSPVALPTSPMHIPNVVSVGGGLALESGLTPLVGALKEISQR
jgi:hypothetical protein